jgi:hypothetical protein
MNWEPRFDGSKINRLCVDPFTAASDKVLVKHPFGLNIRTRVAHPSTATTENRRHPRVLYTLTMLPVLSLSNRANSKSQVIG